MASSQQRLPSAETAYVEEKKITDYLLNDTHPQGRSKARFFRSFGFVLERGEELSAALVKQAQIGTVISQEFLPDSTQYAVRCRRRDSGTRRTQASGTQRVGSAT